MYSGCIWRVRGHITALKLRRGWFWVVRARPSSLECRRYGYDSCEREDSLLFLSNLCNEKSLKKSFWHLQPKKPNYYLTTFPPFIETRDTGENSSCKEVVEKPAQIASLTILQSIQLKALLLIIKSQGQHIFFEGMLCSISFQRFTHRK